MPREVTAVALEHWLEQLGRCFRHSGRLYLVGGTSLLLTDAKTVTLDVDVQFEIDPTYHTEWIHCIRQVSRQLGIPVEQASPADFIPLPSDHESRHEYVGRFGQLDVFHFDFYSVALSKLHRSNEKDLADVISMVRQGLVDSDQLRRYFQEILPRLVTHDISASPEDFTRKYALFEQRLGHSTTD